MGNRFVFGNKAFFLNLKNKGRDFTLPEAGSRKSSDPFVPYKKRIHHKNAYPLLSCSDIEELLARFLPRRDVTREEARLQLEHRYIQRQKAIEPQTRYQKNQFISKNLKI
jgi:hypothetical protein